MKKSFLLFLILINTQFFTQSSLDSLKQEIDTLSVEEKIKRLNHECIEHRSKNPNYALDCGLEAVEIAQNSDLSELTAEALNTVSRVYRNLGNYSKALQYSQDALEIARAINDSIQIAYSYNNIGNIYRVEKQYTAALRNTFDALNIFESLGDMEGIANSTFNIGVIYRNQKNYDKALEYLDRTLEVREEIGDEFEIAVAVEQFAKLNFEMENFSAAKSFYKQLLDLYEKLEDEKGIATALGGLADIEAAEGKLRTALNYRSRALDLNTRTNNIEGVLQNYSKISMLHARLGNFLIADELLDQARKIIDSTGNSIYLGDYYFYRASFFEQQNQLEQALAYYKRYSRFKDSLSAAENIESIANMEALYQTEKAIQEKTISEQESNIREKQRNYLLIMSLLLVVLSAFITYKYFQNKKINARLKELNATKDKLFNIVAHDLKNPFNSLLSYTEILIENKDEMSEEEKSKAIAGLHKSSRSLARLVENLLQWARSNTGVLEYSPEKITLKASVLEALSFSKDAIDAKNIKFVENINHALEVYCDEHYLGTVLRNLISNAAKFTPEGGTIQVNAVEKDKCFEISVSDTGIGISKENLEKLFKVGEVISTEGTGNEKGTGLGLILCREFVEKWGGKIFVESELGKGSKFIFTVPKTA